MSGIKDKDTIDSLRKRLYERGKTLVPSKQHDLIDNPVVDVPTHFIKRPQHDSKKHTQSVVNDTVKNEETSVVMQGVQKEQTMSRQKKKRGYRLKILFSGIIFFILALSASSFFLIFGNNSISGNNIFISVTGPFAIGGGEVLPLQVGITNNNSVPIQSATLIVNYPSGTKSTAENGGELFNERLALDTIETGETINVPLRAVIFGEENDEKTVEVSIEYRIQGSNATFFKDADPLRFKISSSPLIVRADTLKKISSGQETDVTVTITSNSPTTLSQVLVKAEYPLGFDYTTSDPKPTTAKNVWLIENLEPESSKTITITGVVIGKETDEYAINFTIGVPNERDQQSIASVFATTQTVFEIEQPFLDVKLQVDRSYEPEIAISPGDRPSASIEVRNTLDDTLYDVVVEVQLGGNAFSVFDVSPSSGFYDSSKNTITWDVSNTQRLESIIPGDSEVLSFSVQPSDNISRTPQLNIEVGVKARRVSESRVAEELVGTAASVIKIVSTPQIRGEAGHNNGIFTDTGSVPPRVSKETTYSMSFMIENGSNDLADAVVTTTLPPYVKYLDETAGAGSLSFNQTTRVLTWEAGSIDANAATFASFQVSLLPRVTQIGTTPTLMREQRIRATDKFTGTVVRDTNPAVTTRLSSESGFGQDNGVVKP